MKRRNGRISAAVLGAVALVAAAAGVANASTGPSSSQSPYVVGSEPGVVTKSILTAGDTVGGYRMVGIPTGSGRSTTATARSRC